jgi:plasmid stabilization system protein ParE
VKLRYTRRGATELDEVLDYIRERSPQGARHVQARVRGTIDLLLRHPHAGRPTSNPRLRRMVIPSYPYLVLYEATEDAIIIHGVRHSARRPSTG